MPYVDGFVAAVPTARKDEFIAFSKMMGPILKEYGALDVVDCWGDDVPEGEVTSFPMAVKCQPDETVCLSWIIWPDKDTRDAGMGNFMSDPRLAPDRATMPFEGKRMIVGGFDMVAGH